MKTLVSFMCVLLILAGVASAVTPVWRTSLEDDTDITDTGGEIRNGPSTYVPGFFGNAFAGNNDVVGRWDNATLAEIIDPVWDDAAGSTVDLYFYGENFETLEGSEVLWSVFDRYDGNDGYYVIQVIDGNLAFYYKNSYTGERFNNDTTVALANNTVYRLTVRQYGTTLEAYLDGGAYSNITPAYSFSGWTETCPFPEFNDFGGNRYMWVGDENFFGGKLRAGSWVDEISLYNGYYLPSELPEPSEMLLAWAPDPDDEASNIALNTDLEWSIPVDANEILWTYNVYFDTDSTFASTTPVSAGPLPVDESRASVTNTQIGGPLSLGMYYWRVDSVDPNVPFTPSTRTGPVWSFDAGATLPVLVAPADTYDPEVEIDVDLEWSSDAIVDASRIIITPEGGSAINLGEQTSPFNPWADAGIAMEWDKQYTWQVIELDASDNALATGPVWKFKVRALNCVGMTADIDGSEDCIVNLADFAAFAGQWLDCNWDDGGKTSPCP